jgi:hypothetical protein
MRFQVLTAASMKMAVFCLHPSSMYFILDLNMLSNWQALVLITHFC